MSDFVHLHLHTEYSLLDGLNRIEPLMAKLQEYKMESVAITDHGVMYGVPEFWKTAKDTGIKPIIGCEIYLAPTDRTLRQPVDGINYYHLLLLAKNAVGYRNLTQIVTESHLTGMYYRPRADRELLQKYAEGLICTTACLAGPLSRHILKDETAKAEDWLQFLKHTFKDDFYLELQRNGFDSDTHFDQKLIEKYDQETVDTIKAQMKVNLKLREYAERFKVPLVATTDAHYLNADDKDVQKVLFCIKDGLLLNDEKARDGYLDTYVRSSEDMLAAFADDKTPLENSLKIAEQVELINLKPDRVQPRFWNLPKGKSAKELLREQTFAGAKTQYPEITKELEERIEYELMVIDSKGYNDYFLVVGDFMQYARSRGMIISVRGSAAGSVVSYCLDITNVDPIKWDLVFERFLNLERPSPPDIDMDLQDDRRDEVIEYAKEKYGMDNVAAISAMGSLQTKAAIRDVARVMGIDIAVADKLSKMVVTLFGKNYNFDKMMEVNPDFNAIVSSDPQLLELGEHVRKIEGISRHISTHACGYLITPEPISTYMPLQRDSKDPDKLITQMDGTWIDKLDFMKFDFLGLRTLTIIKNSIDLIKQNHGVEINLKEIPDDDLKTYELFSKGQTVGVFQFESPPMQDHLKHLKPETLEDICFLAAAYRPGPMAYIPDYIECKNGRKEPEYVIPELEPILKKTYGFPIYQEQLLQICQQLGGFTLGDGDVIRNALKKKQLDILEAKHDDFSKYFVEHFDYGVEIADKIWGQLQPFADYGFNRAHAASYAMVAYWCAYLKANYPLEFMAALMHSDLSNQERIILDIKDASRMGYDILVPDVNKSETFFTPEGSNAIRFGLGAIKNVSTKTVEAIVAERKENGPFTHLDELVARVTPANLSKKDLEYLIRAGALDSFGERNALLTIMPGILERQVRLAKEADTAQMGLFAGLAENAPGTTTVDRTMLPQVDPISDGEKLQWEKELLGIFLSSHPLDQYSWASLDPKLTPIAKLASLKEGTKVQVLCTLDGIKTIRSKKDGKPMAFVTIADKEANCEAVLFNSTYTENQEKLVEGKVVLIIGKTSHRNDTVSILVDKIVEELKPPSKITLDIRGVTDQVQLAKLKDHFSDDGMLKVEIIYGTQANPKKIARKTTVTEDALLVFAEYITKGHE